MLKRAAVRISMLATLLVVAMGVSGCPDNRPRNGAGQPVDSDDRVTATRPRRKRVAGERPMR
jgi:hypothetical protein